MSNPTTKDFPGSMEPAGRLGRSLKIEGAAERRSRSFFNSSMAR
jgi:hypothetical protein